jgi:PII-like signaling protein
MSHFHTIAALRIYLRHGDNRKSPKFWGRMFEKPLATHLVQAALRSDIQHAAVTLGHMGFTKDATRVTHNHGEIPMATLPVCVELLAPKRRLEQFVKDQSRHLAGTTMVMVEGIHVSSLHLAELDEVVDRHPHAVEYITGGAVPLEIDHVRLENAADANGRQHVGR